MKLINLNYRIIKRLPVYFSFFVFIIMLYANNTCFLFLILTLFIIFSCFSILPGIYSIMLIEVDRGHACLVLYLRGKCSALLH